MQTRKQRRRSYKRIKWIGAVILAVILLLGGLLFASHRFSANNETAAADDAAAWSEDKVMQVMILGVDSRKDDVGRSDTLMVASVDFDHDKAGLLSVPRDTRVNMDIKGHKFEKINHAYAYGGHELSQKCVENLLGVHIDHYIIIDTSAFKKIIDAMGGVDINVEKRMHYEDPWDDNGGLVIDLYPGEQHMDGDKAIQYVRYRDGEGDIGRIGRQQKFIKAVMDKLITPEMLPKLPDIVKEASAAIKTDMSLSDLLQFANIMKQVHDNGLSAQMVPGQPAYIDDISYWIPDITDTRDLMASELGMKLTDEQAKQAQKDEDAYMKSLPKGLKLLAKSSGKLDEDKKDDEDETPMKPEEISVMVINESGINGAGAEVASMLQKKGFVISSVETGKTNAREQTTITTSKRNTDVFYGMPFNCTIMEGGDKNQAVVRIGADYKYK